MPAATDSGSAADSVLLFPKLTSFSIVAWICAAETSFIAARIAGSGEFFGWKASFFAFGSRDDRGSLFTMGEGVCEKTGKAAKIAAAAMNRDNEGRKRDICPLSAIETLEAVVSST